MVWEGDNVITDGRAMLGSTSPHKSSPGTIRGDLASGLAKNGVANICHGSDGPEAAQREINLWFTQ
jgi:nucleoside-diphosphate kinase